MGFLQKGASKVRLFVTGHDMKTSLLLFTALKGLEEKATVLQACANQAYRLLGYVVRRAGV